MKVKIIILTLLCLTITNLYIHIVHTEKNLQQKSELTSEVKKQKKAVQDYQSELKTIDKLDYIKQVEYYE